MADQTPDLTYVNSSNGKIYVNGIILDDCYDIQYTYKEMKEPLYGYNSKYFDAIVPGSVIIHGSFTINYKHDGYLRAILNMGSNDIEASASKIEDSKKFNSDYRVELATYRDLQQKIKKAQDALAQKKAALEIEKVKSEAAATKAKAEAQFKAEKIQEAQNLEDEARNVSVVDKERVDKSLAAYDDLSAKAQQNKDNALEKVQGLNNKLAEMRNQEGSLLAQKMTKQGLIAITKTNIQTGAIKSSDGYETIANTEREVRDIDYKREQLNKQIESQKALIEEFGKFNANNTKDAEGQLGDITSDNPEVEAIVKARTAKLKAQADAAQAADMAAIDLEISKQDLADATKAMSDAQAYLSGLIAMKNNALNKITELKSRLDSIAPNWDELKKLDAVSGQQKSRAEDMGYFNVFVNYNGLNHKILKNCILTGHSHVVQQGGEAVKEYYSFIAQKVV